MKASRLAPRALKDPDICGRADRSLKTRDGLPLNELFSYPSPLSVLTVSSSQLQTCGMETRSTAGALRIFKPAGASR